MAFRQRRIIPPVVVLVLAATATIGWRLLMPPDPDTLAVRAAAEGALRGLHFDAYPPPTYAGGPLPSPVAVAIRSRISTDIERYFAEPLRARYEPMILSAVDTIGRSDWDADGGASFDWGPSSIRHDHATISLHETMWVVRRGGQYGTQPDATYRLDSTELWQMELVRDGIYWRVASLLGHCESGCP